MADRIVPKANVSTNTELIITVMNRQLPAKWSSLLTSLLYSRIALVTRIFSFAVIISSAQLASYQITIKFNNL